MDKKKGILLAIFLIFLVIPLSSASSASSEIHSIGSYDMGSAGNTPEGTDFTSRDIITYQQAGTDNATSEIYSLNLGWFKKIITSEEESAEEEEATAGGGGGGTVTAIAFDVDILEFDSPAKLGNFFDFTYFVKGIGDINNDVTIDFWIEKDGEVITSGSSVVFMGLNEEKIGTASLFLPSDIVSGKYKFVLQASFRASKGEAHRTIEIIIKDGEAIIDKLFDIFFRLEDPRIENSDELLAIVTFENFGTVTTQVELTFIILDDAENKVYTEEDSIVVETEELLRKSFEDLDLPRGKYTLVLKTLYNDNVFDEFRQDFEIVKKRRGLTGNIINFVEGSEKWYVIWTVIFGLFVWLIWWLIGKQKKRKEKKQRKKVKVHKKSLFTKKGTFIKIIDKKSRGRRKNKIRVRHKRKGGKRK